VLFRSGDKNDDLVTQFYKIKGIMDKKWPNCKYIGYFQARTNTYAPVEVLKEKYEKILSIPNVVGLSIATRPDAISDECMEYLKDLNKRTFLTVELGLQTIHPKTSKLINRCHDLECFEKTLKELQKNNIFTVVHIINGLPYETDDMMIETVKYLNKMNIDGIKIHMLSVLKNTPLEEYYSRHKFHILSEEEYIDIVIKQLRHLNPKIVIQRLTGDPTKEDLIEPKWTTNKIHTLNSIDKIMSKNDLYQGDKILRN